MPGPRPNRTQRRVPHERVAPIHQIRTRKVIVGLVVHRHPQAFIKPHQRRHRVQCHRGLTHIVGHGWSDPFKHPCQIFGLQNVDAFFRIPEENAGRGGNRGATFTVPRHPGDIADLKSVGVKAENFINRILFKDQKTVLISDNARYVVAVFPRVHVDKVGGSPVFLIVHLGPPDPVRFQPIYRFQRVRDPYTLPPNRCVAGAREMPVRPVQIRYCYRCASVCAAPTHRRIGSVAGTGQQLAIGNVRVPVEGDTSGGLRRIKLYIRATVGDGSVEVPRRIIIPQQLGSSRYRIKNSGQNLILTSLIMGKQGNDSVGQRCAVDLGDCIPAPYTTPWVNFDIQHGGRFVLQQVELVGAKV